MSTESAVKKEIERKYKRSINIDLIKKYLQIYKQAVSSGKKTYFPPLKSTKAELQYNQNLVTNILWSMGIKATHEKLDEVHMTLDALQILAMEGKVPLADYSPRAAKQIAEQQKKQNPNLFEKVGQGIVNTATGVGDAVNKVDPLQKVGDITRNVAIIAAVGAGIYLIITLKKSGLKWQ